MPRRAAGLTARRPAPAGFGGADPDRGDAEDFAAAVAALTAAFGDPTRRDIYLWVHRGGGPVTAAQVAETFALHPNVARHHLEKLTAGGYLTAEQGAPGAGRGAGRPSRRYRPSARTAALGLPAPRDDLVGTLLARALEELAPARAEALAEDVGAEYGRALAERIAPGSAHRSAQTAVTAVAEVLTAHGFAARSEAAGRRLSIVSEHCPFGEAARRYPHVMCALDRGLIRGLMEGLHGRSVDPRLVASRPGGDGCCVTRL
jgi:predicted ArsR family transcriptional regulator